MGALTREQFSRYYDTELTRVMSIQKKKRVGGSFYPTQTARVGKRFARAIVASTLEGQALYRDVFRLLCVSKPATFHKLADALEIR